MEVRFFEQGPIRPPSEAQSLLVRVNRNCPWNKCAFCRTYKGTKFELRDVKEVKRDIDAIADIVTDLKELSFREGEGGQMTRRLLSLVYNRYHEEGYRRVAFWLYFGGKNVFLQDADPLIMKTEAMVEILSYLREKLKSVERITTYLRAKTACIKSEEDFKKLKEAGLSRIHMGLESGSDVVLQLVKKGVTKEEHIKAGRKIREANLSLCTYVMPGLGGKMYTHEHARETASVISAINPDFVRLRSLHVVKGTPLREMMEKNEFFPLTEDETVGEIREFIEQLQVVETTLVSDHILNLLEEVEGKIPQEKGKILEVIDKYFSLPEEERMVFQLGRRMGIYRGLGDLQDLETYLRLKTIVEEYRGADHGAFERYLNSVKDQFV